jgi:hypothetical protein
MLSASRSLFTEAREGAVRFDLRGVAVVVVGALIGAAILVVGAGAAFGAPLSRPTVVDNCAAPVPGHFACYAQRRSDLGFTPATRFARGGGNAPMSAGAPYGYGPADLRSAYALPSTTAGAGQRVYIVDAYDDPSAAADLATYRSQYALPACTVGNGCLQKLNQNGATSPLPSPDPGWAGETSLDLDMVSAICPNCGITLIEANDASDNLFVAVRRATTLGAKFVSMSWGAGEGGYEPSLDSSYFLPSGVVYTASTGDGAYAAGVSYPATSPRVVAVGGTSLTRAGNARGWSEHVWGTDVYDGAGSGCSAVEAKPAFQSGIAGATCPRRADSDVSAVADPQTGVAVYQGYGGGGWAVYGGTSAASPIVASVFALAGQPGANDVAAGYLYAHAGELNDVTGGSNGSCSPAVLCVAGVGWDGPTGLGTPSGLAAFTASGAGPSNTISVTSPGAQRSVIGDAVNRPVAATDSAAGTLSYSASGLPAGLSIDPATGTISGTPSVAGRYPVVVSATDGASTGSAGFTWSVIASALSCTGQHLVNGGFETASGWSATSGVLRHGPRPRTGTGFALLDGYGRVHTDTLAQRVAIPAGCRAVLVYYLRVGTRETQRRVLDTLRLTVNGSLAQHFSNLDVNTGYRREAVDLTGWSGRSVVLKWTGVENGSQATSFLIDDASVTLS